MRNAVAHADSPASYPFSHATTGSHRFIEISGEIKALTKMHIVSLTEWGLQQVSKHLYRAKITLMGLNYKKNINDPGESPVIKIVEGVLSGAECAPSLVNHDLFQWIAVETVKGRVASSVVVDGENLLTGGEEIVYLGIGKRLV